MHAAHGLSALQNSTCNLDNDGSAKLYAYIYIQGVSLLRSLTPFTCA